MYRTLATIMLAGVGVMFSHPALAQVINLQPQTSGTLVQSLDNFHRLQTSTEATVDVVLNLSVGSSATVQVAAPTLLPGPIADPDGTTSTATVTFLGGLGGVGGSVNSGEPAKTLPIGITSFRVSMAVERPTSYPPGTYSYQVTITVTATPL